MSLKDEIQNRFKSDVESILADQIGEVEGMFEFHEDGTIELGSKYRELNIENQILLYLIARRYQYEGDLADTKSIEYGEMYTRFPKKDESTIRGYFMNLRNDGFARKSDEGHEMVVERLLEAVNRLKSAVSES